MAMSTATLKAAIISELTSQYGAPADADQQSKFAEAVAKAVVEHIQTFAVVSVTVSTTGTASAQTGTGTGTVA